MKNFCTLAALALSVATGFAATTNAPKLNVLLVIADDLRAELGCYGGAAITPNLDKLAATGVRFDRAYTQYPLCCPSRTSMLTGHKPTVTGVFGNRTWIGDTHPEFVTLPRWFKDHGYVTARSGKIFHDGIDDTDAWAEGGDDRFLAGVGSETNALKRAQRRPAKIVAASEGATNRAPGMTNEITSQSVRGSDRWVVYEGNGESDHDYRVANRTIAQLAKYQARPFFLACGFSKPHSPPGAPQKFYDLYNLTNISLPVNFAPRPTVPEGFPKQSIRPRNADLFIGRDATTNAAKEMTRAYLAACSYLDANVGRVLAELDRLNLRTNTIIVFWSDHGYQLGERGKWSKAGSLFEQGARVPTIIYLPDAKGNGHASPRVVESLDFYATLADLCGLPAPKNLEGRSLAPLLQNPQAEWNHPAFTVWSENGKTLRGVGVRNERWRYTEFEDGTAMLFDEVADPLELKNVVADPKNHEVRAELSKLVKNYTADFKPAK